jgi:FixJ family two-component response regulator
MPPFSVEGAPVMTPREAARDLVFVVDDDESVCRALSVLIESAGYETRWFTSGAAFVAASRSAAGRCAVVDVAMPGLDGAGVLSALRSAGDRLPVIFVTAHDVPAKHRQLVADGGRTVLLKPVEPSALLAEIAQAGGISDETSGA